MPPRDPLRALHAEIVECRACPRLVRWREQVAREKKRAYRDQEYWGRPITGFGDPGAALVLVGLAPAAHGGNRTGRIFTGDRSGDFLFASLHRLGVANQPQSVSRDDGLELTGAFILAPVRCAPPDNKPTPDEFARCSCWFDAELSLLPNARVYLALGAHAWRSTLEHLARTGSSIPKPRPEFGHGAIARIPRAKDEAVLVGSYHVSQQNTQTGKLTPAMFDRVVARALKEARR
ncbi:MAG: uracil-DNA glycosylase [Deltaproteobacteria bacterium]|nr:uracil-DNA glycosylase [Deltaproteobacteria bacterium]